jgi:hypothetical protein
MFLAYFPHSEKKKCKFWLMRSPPCLCVYPYQLLNAWTNLYETWHVYHGTWSHFNGVLHKSLPSVCASVPLSSLGNGSVNTFPRQRIHAIELLGASFPMLSVSIKGESVRLCMLLLLLGNRSINNFPPQWRTVGGVFCVVRVISKESRRFVLPRTSC